MKGYFSFSINKKRITYIITDITILLISILLAYIIRYGIILKNLPQLPLNKIIIYFFFYLPQLLFVFYITGIYERWGMATYSRTIIRVFISISIIGVFNGLLFYFYWTLYFGRVVFILQLAIFLFIEGIVRFFLILKLKKNQKKRDLIMINFTDEEEKLFKKESSIFNYCNLKKFIYDDKETLSSFLKTLNEESIIVVSSHSKTVGRDIGIYIRLKFKKYAIYDMHTFYINITGKIPFNTFGDIWSILTENEFLMGINSYYKLKRILDVILSLGLLILLSPLFLIFYIIIKLTSKGPAFFIQERLGWNKKPFNLIKFRSMKINAEADTGPVWSSKDDPRITSLGKLIRKTRLDELPQLLNVLKGDISFVGNRPIRKHFAEILADKTPFYELRFMIKPGLTGWSQVKYEYAGSVEEQIEKFKYELFYIKNMSFLFDVIIIIKTIKIVFGMKGS